MSRRRAVGVSKPHTGRAQTHRPKAQRQITVRRRPTLGRVGRLCLKVVTEHVVATGAQLSDQCRAALVRFSDMLKHSLPRMVLARRQEPLYMCTDASYEPSNATWPCGIGGVLFNTVGRPVRAFSSHSWAKPRSRTHGNTMWPDVVGRATLTRACGCLCRQQLCEEHCHLGCGQI